jgi:hypothetical protein
MEKTLWDLVASVRAFSLNIGDKQAITKASNRFSEQLKRHSTIELLAIKNQHYQTLLKLKHNLLSIKERSVHDRIFNILQMPKNSPQQITLVFKEFIKGITYFRNQKDSQDHPIYHRLASCGEAFNICTNKTAKEKRRVKKIIERCYLERLIYNEIYINQTINEDQDKAHIHWLEQTRQDFQTCFPRLDLKVSIDSWEDIFPTKLRIEKYKNGVITYTETFQKELIHGTIPVYEEITVITRNNQHVRIQRF